MRYPAYPAYKDSGVAWLGDVPLHWERKRLRFVATMNPSKQEASQHERETPVSFLPMEAVGDDGTLKLDSTRPIAEVENGYTYFAEGDVTLAKITPCFENGKGAIMRGLVNGIGFGTTELAVIRPNADTDVRYLYYLTMSQPFRKRGEAVMYGAGGQKRVPDSFIRNFDLAWPPLPEQAAIAAFLDRETAKIAALLARQERLIALLGEKRQALIAHAVTKGLDNAAPMQDTGVAWLGEIPAHWSVRRLKTCITAMGQGWSPQCENRQADVGEWGVLKVGCVNRGYFNPLENKALPEAIEPIHEHTIKADDVLISRANTRDLVGSAALVTQDYPFLLLCDKLYRLRLNESQCLPQYAVMLLRTAIARNQIEIEATGASSSMLNIGQETIKNLVFPFPSAPFLKYGVDQRTRRSYAISERR